MRRLRSLLAEERGSASLEFIGAGLILLIPLIYLIITLAQIQGQSLGIEAAARHVARVISQHPETAGSAQQTANLIAEQYGIAPARLTVSITCPESVRCPAPGALMTVTVTTHTQLPLVPQALGVGDITLSTTSTHLLAETP